MLAAIYQQISEKIFSFAGTLKVYQLVSICTLLTLVSYFPDIRQYKTYDNLYHSIDQEINAPFDAASYTYSGAPEFNMHTENRKFRLLIPAMANLLQADARRMLWLQFLLLPVFILAMYKSFLKTLHDQAAAAILTIALPFFFVAESFFWVMPIYDGYGYLLLAFLFLTNHHLLRYLILVAICFSDERAIISTLLVYIALQLHEYKKIQFRNLVSINRLNLVFISGWLTYFTIRYLLTAYMGVNIQMTGNHGIYFLMNNYGTAPLGIFLAFEGFWILILPALLSILFQKKWFEASVIMGSLLFFFSINLMVFDITRSFGYCYTFIFIALLLLARNEQISLIRHLALFTTLGCLLIPTMLIYSQNGSISISWLTPILPKIIRFF